MLGLLAAAHALLKPVGHLTELGITVARGGRGMKAFRRIRMSLLED